MDALFVQIVAFLNTIDPVYAAVAVIAIWIARRAGWLKMPSLPKVEPEPKPEDPADPDGPILDFLKDWLKKLLDKARAEGKDPHAEVKRVLNALHPDD